MLTPIGYPPHTHTQQPTRPTAHIASTAATPRYPQGRRPPPMPHTHSLSRCPSPLPYNSQLLASCRKETPPLPHTHSLSRCPSPHSCNILLASFRREVSRPPPCPTLIPSQSAPLPSPRTDNCWQAAEKRYHAPSHCPTLTLTSG